MKSKEVVSTQPSVVSWSSVLNFADDWQLTADY